MLEFLLEKAEKEKSLKRLKQINQLKSAAVNNAKVFQKRAKLLSNARGIMSNKNYNDIFFTTAKNMFTSREYTLRDVIRAVRGMEFCQDALLPELSELNLFEKIDAIEVPVHFIQGMKDAVAPYKIARKYFEFLEGQSKSFIEFEHSAHMPH